MAALTARQQLIGRSEAVSAAVCKSARDHLDAVLGGRYAIAAVGGFGRGELFPHSDVDLLVLVDRTESAVAAKDAIGAFLRTLWDAGLAPSHSVRTPAECRQFDINNVELTVSLLTRRFLCGEQAIYNDLSTALPDFIRVQRRSVTEHLLRQTAQRYARFHETIYHLEPDLKEGPGGLRDLHLIEWLGLLRGAPYREVLDALVPAREFLWGLRIALHQRSKRDENRLLFDAQDDLFPNPEAGMRDYFRHARAIARETKRLRETVHEPGGGMIRSFLDWRSRLSNAEFTVAREQVFLRSPGALASDNSLPLRLMQFIARHGFRLSPDSERRLSERFQAPQFEPPRLNLWRELADLLKLPHAAHALRAMQETGLLTWILPEWRRIECLVTRDFYHRYTVDEHTLVTLDNLEALAESKDAARETFRTLLSETADLHLLRLALLLHDIGKGGGEGNHEVISRRIAAEVLARLGAPESDRDTILFLVERHLDLSSLMTARDLHDDATLEAAAHRIGTIERLQLLTLMTFADISAVNPTALTPWRMSQLWSAYRGLHHELTRELDTDRILPETVPAHLAAFLDGFPTRYPLVHSVSEIEGHAAMAERLTDEGASVKLDHLADAWVLTVVTRDRPRLFADLAGTLSSFGMNILRAEAFGNRHGVVVDMLRFADPVRRLELNPEEVQDLTRLATRVALGQENIARRLAGRPRPVAPSRRARIEPVARFDNSASSRASLLEIVAEDRPGLLYDVAHALGSAGCSIEVVLVNTEGQRALDVFYVTAGGDKLPPNLQDSLGLELRRILSRNH
jgi:[protein-PII] uridylyltransferase